MSSLSSWRQSLEKRPGYKREREDILSGKSELRIVVILFVHRYSNKVSDLLQLQETKKRNKNMTPKMTISQSLSLNE